MDEPTQIEDDDVSIDAILELLATRWCRYVLCELLRNDSLELSDVARRIADREYDDPSEEQLDSVRVQLHHRVLPKLETHGCIERDGDQVRCGDYAPLAEPYVLWASEWES